MAPSKQAGAIKVNIPRLNSIKISPSLISEVETVAKEQHTNVAIRDTIEPSSSLALAIESASEWNSMLMTARANRGPQWDVGTQQFMVDEGSELCYDPSSLRQKDTKLEGQPSTEFGKRPMAEPHTPQGYGQRGPLQHPPNAYHQYNNIPLSSPAGPSHHHPQMMNNYSGSPYGNQIPPNQIYGDASGSPVNMRMAMGGNQDARSMSPDVRRRVTRAMTEDGYPLHGI